MTKSDIVSKISHRTSIKQSSVRSVTDALFDIIQEVVSEGGGVHLRNFGIFSQKKRARRVARNIAKNTAMIIDEHYAPSFKPASFFTQKVRNS